MLQQKISREIAVKQLDNDKFDYKLNKQIEELELFVRHYMGR